MTSIEVKCYPISSPSDHQKGRPEARVKALSLTIDRLSDSEFLLHLNFE